MVVTGFTLLATNTDIGVDEYQSWSLIFFLYPLEIGMRSDSHCDFLGFTLLAIMYAIIYVDEY